MFRYFISRDVKIKPKIKKVEERTEIEVIVCVSFPLARSLLLLLIFN